MNNRTNQLILIENGLLTSYCLDDRQSWELGRGSADFHPDIRLHTMTVSRKHGRFQNIEGCWYYVEYGVKNRTKHNDKFIRRGLGGRVRPVMLQSGDAFLFGGGENGTLDSKTAWALFSDRCWDDHWRVVDTRNAELLTFSDGSDVTRLDHPQKGTVIEQRDGMGIYMGDLSYLYGNTELQIGKKK